MDSKYLPIGSVCTLKGRKEKVMIIGLYSILLDNQIKVYDYKGCAFPRGVTLSNQLFSFNQEDIEKVEYRGYDSEEHKELLSLLADKLSKDEVTAAKSNAGFPQFSNFVFDENGYVIKADSSSDSNPFINQVPIEEKKENNSIFRDIKFDENGTVIAVDDKKTETDTSTKNDAGDYEFDENGVVISAKNESVATVNATESLPVENLNQELNTNNSNGFIFDENGTVIAVDGQTKEQSKSVPEEKTTSNYQFDENGVVIAAKNEPIATNDATSSPETEESNVPDIEYEFDENGIIVGIKSQKE